MTERNRLPGWLFAIISACAIIVGCIIFVLIAWRFDFTFNDKTGGRTYEIAEVVSIYGALICGSVYCAFLAVSHDEASGVNSPLLFPRIFGLGALFAYFLIQGARSYDVFLHGARDPQWKALYQPEVTLLLVILVLVFLCGKAMELAVILVQREGWTRERVTVTYASIAVAIAACLTISLMVVR